MLTCGSWSPPARSSCGAGLALEHDDRAHALAVDADGAGLAAEASTSRTLGARQAGELGGRAELEVERAAGRRRRRGRASACRARRRRSAGRSRPRACPAGGVASNVSSRRSRRRRRRRPRARAPARPGPGRRRRRAAARRGRVPGELGGAEQPAVVLRGDPDGVGRPAGGRGRLGAGQRPARRQAVEAALHVRRGSGSSCCGLVLARPAARTCRRSWSSCRRRSGARRRRRSGRRRPRTAARAARGRRWPATGGPRRRRRAGRRRRSGSEPEGSRPLVNVIARGHAVDRGSVRRRRGRRGRAAWERAWGRSR